MRVQLLISPLVAGAYFADHRRVCLAELGLVLPSPEVRWIEHGPLELLACEIAPETLPRLARLSFVQGIFEERGTALVPIDQGPDLLFDASLVSGSKYRGKTNELLTQLAINVGLAHLDPALRPTKLLDPMAGRRTTLLLALRYGMNATGIERDPRALAALHRELKKHAKLKRLKHRLTRGVTGSMSRKTGPAREVGAFLQFEAMGKTLKLVAGESASAGELLAGERFPVIVADLPYGIEHGFDGRSGSLLSGLEACAPAWSATLAAGGVLVLSFNRSRTDPEELCALFERHGLVSRPFSVRHRMSESIVRELAVFCAERAPSVPGRDPPR